MLAPQTPGPPRPDLGLPRGRQPPNPAPPGPPTADVIPPQMRRSIALYEAARALIGYITPSFDEIQRVCSSSEGKGGQTACSGAVGVRGTRTGGVPAVGPPALSATTPAATMLVGRSVAVTAAPPTPPTSFASTCPSLQVSVCPGGLATGYTYFLPQVGSRQPCA